MTAKRNRIEPAEARSASEKPKQPKRCSEPSAPPKDAPPKKRAGAACRAGSECACNPPARDEGPKKKKDEPTGTDAGTKARSRTVARFVNGERDLKSSGPGEIRRGRFVLEQLGDLDGVQRRAFEQLIARDPEGKAVLERAIQPNPARLRNYLCPP